MFGSTVLGASQLTTPFSSLHFSIGKVILSGDYLAIIVVAAVVTIALGLFFRVTRTGLGGPRERRQRRPRAAARASRYAGWRSSSG